MKYVTYDEVGALTGSFDQPLHGGHESNHIEVSNDVRLNWTAYQANAERTGVALIPPPPFDQVAANAALAKTGEALAQSHMDKTAQSLGYDNLLSAMSYRNDSTVQKWQQEGQAFYAWRPAVWLKCIEIQGKILAGLIAVPTEAEFIAMLPAITGLPA